MRTRQSLSRFFAKAKPQSVVRRTSRVQWPLVCLQPSVLLVLLLALGGCNSGLKSELGNPTATPAVDSQGKDSTFAKGASSSSATPESPDLNDQATAPSQPEFTDIADIPTQASITALKQLGVFENSGSEFKPYDTLTRGEYIIWMFKTNNAISSEENRIRPDPTFELEFTDIAPEHPAYKYVQALASAGFAVGYEDKTFKPDQPITREEMIAIKVGLDSRTTYGPLQGIVLNYTDFDQIDRRYTGYFGADGNLSYDNVSRAFGNIKTLKPKQPVKRYEAAATLAVIDTKTVEQALERQENAK
ncbi:MAG: S-layer homology domain-containing protein [Thermosynechococcaceae cyanobacterium]